MSDTVLSTDGIVDAERRVDDFADNAAAGHSGDVGERRSSAPVPAGLRPWWRRPVAIALCLLVLYLGVAQLTDPRAYLSTDTGGKTATLEAMVEGGDWDPDLGYWAASYDPDGSLYPMWSTKRIDDSWINVTSLPMILAARPLYAVGGYRAALLLPMLGTIAAALAAGALSRRLGSLDGALATWAVGLSGPLFVYALDFWEHSIGIALMGWGVVALIDRCNGSEGLLAALSAGLLFGAAGTMRQEALVYGFVAGIVLVGMLLLRRQVISALFSGAAMVFGTILMIAANAVLEIGLVGESFRTSRSTGTVAAGGSSLGLRFEEAIITAAVPFSPGQLTGMIAAVALVAGLAWLTIAVLDGHRPVIPAVIVGGIYLVLFLEVVAIGPSFVQGMIATTPLAGVGLACGVRRRDPEALIVMVVALGSLPLVWAVQFTGGALPQWGGRYILLSGWALMTIAVSHLESRSPEYLRAIAGVGLAVTGLGVWWTIQRTNAVGSAFEQLVQIDEPVLVFADPFLSREGGPKVIENDWLAAVSADDRAEAATVLTQAEADSFGYVTRSGRELDVEAASSFVGFVLVNETRIEVFEGFDYVVQHFEAR